MKDPAYLALVRQLRCTACTRPGPSEAHHRTGAGMARKSPDRDTMPLCAQCHRDFHGLTGRFKGWQKHQLRDWQAARVELTRGLVAALRGERVAP